jgi:YihY family inner membrane protein
MVGPVRLWRCFDARMAPRPWLGVPIAVVRKYADDRGSALSGLVTFHVFLGMLPLLVVALTLFGRVLEGSEELRDGALDSALAQLPLIGPRLREDVSGLQVGGPALAISLVALLWSASGIYHSLQLAMNQVWNVEGVDRQGFVSRHLRALLLFGLLLLAAVATAPIRRWSLPSALPDPLAWVLSAVGSLALAMVLLLAVLRTVVAPAVPSVRLVPAALLAGALWEVLQRVGVDLVGTRLREASDLYGGLALVVVTLLWINLLARATVLANEVAVVAWRRLWPRRIAQPPLTDADRRVLTALARNERRRPEQHVVVTFDPSGDDGRR